MQFEALLDGGILGNGLAVLGVGDDALARVDVDGGEAAVGEGIGDHAAGDALAVGDDHVGDARGELADGGEAAEDFFEGIEFGVHPRMRRDDLRIGFGKGEGVGGIAGLHGELGGGVMVANAEAFENGEGAGAVPTSGRG